MENMLVADDEQVFIGELDEPEALPSRPKLRTRLWRLIGRLGRGIASLFEWLFGVLSLVLGLSILAALPVVQFLSLGYFLESSARVARSGRIRHGFVGVRKAARVGGVTAGIWLSLVPTWFAGAYARSAELISPGGRTAVFWRGAFVAVTLLAMLHIAVSCLRGGRIRYFLWPFGHPLWVLRRLRRGGLYSEARDGLWAFAASLRIPYYFRLGLIGFFGTLLWLAIPGILIALVGVAPLLAPIGMLLLAIIVPFLPFLQVRYALEGKISALFSRRAIRQRFRCAPVGVCLFALRAVACVDSALPFENRDDSARGGVAAEPGVCDLSGAGAAVDRLGLCSIGAGRASAGMQPAIAAGGGGCE